MIREIKVFVWEEGMAGVSGNRQDHRKRTCSKSSVFWGALGHAVGLGLFVWRFIQLESYLRSLFILPFNVCAFILVVLGMTG